MTKRTIPALLCLLAILFSWAAARRGCRQETGPDRQGPQGQRPISRHRRRRFVFCSGSCPSTRPGKIVPGTIEDQTRQVLKNLSAVLEAGGSLLDNVVKCTVLMTDLTEFQSHEPSLTPSSSRLPARPGRLSSRRAALGARSKSSCIAVQR